MSPSDADVPMHVGNLYRYPVKSMLGEAVDAVFVDGEGVENDRRLALIDEVTGRVASAKQARLWRILLTCRASVDAGRVTIHLPDGATVAAEADEVDARLSELLARQMHSAHSRAPGASVERADPEQVLEFGLDAKVDAPLLELAEATPGDSFTDYAPVHAVTTATLERIGTEAERYRPNLVIATPPGYPAYAENEWTGRILEVGQARLRGLGPTPRCVVPTLEHGSLGRAPHALRTPAAENRVAALDMGILPCAGAYFDALNADGRRLESIGDPLRPSNAASPGPDPVSLSAVRALNDHETALIDVLTYAARVREYGGGVVRSAAVAYELADRAGAESIRRVDDTGARPISSPETPLQMPTLPPVAHQPPIENIPELPPTTSATTGLLLGNASTTSAG